MDREPGNTPLVDAGGIYAKLECTNPTGSIKDRVAHYIIEKSEERGLLKPGMAIVEATSGNTGIAFSYFGALKGYEVKIIMPKNMTEERKRTIRDLGAELISCAAGNFAEAAEIRDKITELDGYFNPDQFSNPLNAECHYSTTGAEIIEQIKQYAPRVDAFVAGVGTGGTIVGVARALREVFPDVHIAAVEPTESAVMSGGEPGEHGIQGIGDGFIPALASDGKGGVNELIREVICVSTEEAKRTAHLIREQFGRCVGVSAGANYKAAQKLKEKYQTVVTVFADGYSKYQSAGLKGCDPGVCEDEDPAKRIFGLYKKPS